MDSDLSEGLVSRPQLGFRLTEDRNGAGGTKTSCFKAKISVTFTGVSKLIHRCECEKKPSAPITGHSSRHRRVTDSCDRSAELRNRSKETRAHVLGTERNQFNTKLHHFLMQSFI